MPRIVHDQGTHGRTWLTLQPSHREAMSGLLLLASLP